jgi:NitT/TauT family transport system permease protein
MGYWAAKNKSAEQVIIPLLDIGQSIPVLGFLPGLVLGLIAIFPHSNFGLELSCILMIFTGQVWNMAFSFYSSLKAIPKHFFELSQNISLSPLQRLWSVELPYSASGLAWNSLMSMAGGWFFLTVCEAFTLGDKQFRLPGLGSYMAVAIDQGNQRAMYLGVLTMIAVIVGMDVFFWRPIVAWTSRFRLDEQGDGVRDIPFMEILLKESKIVAAFQTLGRTFEGLKKSHTLKETQNLAPLPQAQIPSIPFPLRRYKKQYWGQHTPIILLVLLGSLLSGKFYHLMEPLTKQDFLLILHSSLYTFLRVLFALIVSTIWAVPFGIWVGQSQTLTRFFQPIIQVAASFPAPMLYPIALFILNWMGVGLGMGASVLMLLGVQWYVLFNVLAGATNISKELQDTFILAGLSKRSTWWNLYLPSVLPSLITGWVTAAGGAWNASIVAEYIEYHGTTLKTIGLGALISAATSTGNYPLLTGALLTMVVIVVSFNRIVWHRAYELVERRFRFER